MSSFLLNNAMQVHRGHAEARKALHLWLDFCRKASKGLAKDWAGCESLNPERLALAERVKRSDNVISIQRDQPSLDSMQQLPKQGFSYSLEQPDLAGIIQGVNAQVKLYFYSPASVISYSEFCQVLQQHKASVDDFYNKNQSVSPYEREPDLLHCHYSFIYAGFGKLEGDIDRGIAAPESAEALESVVMMLSGIAEESQSAKHRDKVLNAQTHAENLRNRVAGVHSLPSLSRSPAK